MHQITLIPGDGIGPEVTRSARDIVTAAGANVTWETVGAGLRTGEECGTPLPANVFESIARTRLALKGPVQTPFGDAYPVVVGDRTHPSVTIALRKE
ncbi:MAG: isocitrate/isopropylmalate family dehydrogenase, partial [Burkholderiales bacterium]|nr:isocitrate/isopropylmalate family dehydrogenase [Burkholderiales bacterium]